MGVCFQQGRTEELRNVLNTINDGDEDIVWINDADCSFRFRVDKDENTASLLDMDLSYFDCSGDLVIPSVITVEGNDYEVAYIESLEPERWTQTFRMLHESIEGIITLPVSVERISPLSSISYIKCAGYRISADNKIYREEDGAIYTVDQANLVLYPGRKDSYFNLPETVVSIAEGCFANSDARRIQLNTNIEKIPDFAFRLHHVSHATKADSNFFIPSTVKTIGAYAFDYCVTPFIPEGVERIEDNAFGYGYFAYIDRESFKHPEWIFGVRAPVVFPSSLQYLGNSVFSNIPQSDETVPARFAPFVEEIYFLGSTPPQCAENSLPSRPEILGGSESALPEFINVYVPQEGMDAYKKLIEDGTWSDFIHLQVLPDMLYVGGMLDVSSWRDARCNLSYQVHELGSAKVVGVDWKVDRPELASIDSNGVLTAHGEGEITVSCTIESNLGEKYYPHPVKLQITEEILSDIREINAGLSSAMPSGVYNLQGMRVGDTAKGLAGGLYLIVNEGTVRKVVIR